MGTCIKVNIIIKEKFLSTSKFTLAFRPLSRQVAVRGPVVLTLFFFSQAAQSVNKALEQFVKPEQLDGENSYKCSKYEGVAAGMGVSQERPPPPARPLSASVLSGRTLGLCALGAGALGVYGFTPLRDVYLCPGEARCPVTGKVCGGRSTVAAAPCRARVTRLW